MSEKTDETVGTPAPAPDPYGETLTPDQHNALQPLLALAAIGNPALQRRLNAATPGEIKRQELKRRAIDGLREHGTIGHAAATAGVGVTTIYRWRTEDPEFARQVDEFLHVSYVETLEASMYRIATSTDSKMANAAVRAGEILLKAENRDKYGDHQRIEQTQTVNHMVQIIHTVRDDHRTRQAQALASLQALRTIDVEQATPPTAPTPEPPAQPQRQT